MKKLLALLLSCMLVLTALSAWAETTGEEIPAEETPQITYDYDELTVAVTTPLTGNFFTSLWGNGTSDTDVRSMIHGYNLIEWDTAEGVFIPDASVVSGVTVHKKDNGDITFIIALYKDLCYSDGTPITARDYAFSLLLTMAPEMEELGASVRRPEFIAGYNDYISGKKKQLSGVKVPSDYILQITIAKDYLPFFYELGLFDCVPYPISVIAPGVRVADDGKGVYLAGKALTADLLKETILDEETGYRTHPTVVSGPYLLTSYEDGTAQFEINPRYKGNSKGKKPTIQKITMLSVPADEMTEAYKEGKVTLLNKVSDAETITDCLEMADENPMYTSASYARSGLSFLSFNTDRAPLDDLAVRQAIAYLTDRDAMAEETLGSYGMKGRGYYGMGQWMYLLLSGTVAYPVKEPASNASAKEKADYEKTMEQWEALSLDDIEPYDMDTEKGIGLLEGAGWNLNENGEAYNPETDKVRYKQTDDGLVPLKLRMAYGKGSAAGPALEGTLAENLAAAGIELTVEEMPGEELLQEYYRLTETEYDMFFLATNFDLVYDPSLSFIQTEDGHYVWKTSGLQDDELYKLTVDMRHTEPADLAGYCAKWLKFQERFMEDLPVLPIYTNMYYDFYPQVLHDYYITENISWPQSIIQAYMADYVPEEAPAAETEPEG